MESGLSWGTLNEGSIECLAERRLTRFQGIQRKNRLHRRTTTNRKDKETTPLISQKPYHNSSMFSPLMFLLHQHIGSESLIPLRHFSRSQRLAVRSSFKGSSSNSVSNDGTLGGLASERIVHYGWLTGLRSQRGGLPRFRTLTRR